MNVAILVAAVISLDASVYYKPEGVPASVYYSGLDAQTQKDPKEDKRPKAYLYTSPACAPCKAVEKLVEAGALQELNVIVTRDKPDWVELTPLLHYTNAKGESRIFKLHQFEPHIGIEEFRKSALPFILPTKATDVGQAPTPIAEVRRVLALLSPQPNETFVDYGCGDGRWLIEAARTYGCRAVGVEIDPEQVDRARRAVDDAGLVGRVKIIEGDVLTANVEAQVGVAYLYPDLLARLKPTLLKLSRFATPYHPVEGVQMQQNGDVWIWQRPAQQVQQPYAIYGGQAYTGRVCNNPRCQMCNAIQQQLAAQQQPSRRWVLRTVPCASCPSGYRQIWVLE